MTAAVAPAGREEQYGSYVGVDEGYHRRETITAAAAAAAVYHRRENSVAAAAAAALCHCRETSVAAAATAAEACYRRPRPPRPENHDRRQEHGGAMDIPGTGGE